MPRARAVYCPECGTTIEDRYLPADLTGLSLLGLARHCRTCGGEPDVADRVIEAHHRREALRSPVEGGEPETAWAAVGETEDAEWLASLARHIRERARENTPTLTLVAEVVAYGVSCEAADRIERIAARLTGEGSE